MRFARLRKVLMGLIILILVSYTAFALYLKILATLMIHHAIDQIEKKVPQVSSIQYDRIHFYPYDFFDKKMSIDHLIIHFKQSGQVLTVDQITLYHFLSLEQNPFGSFEVSLNNVQMTALPAVFSTLSSWNTNLPMTLQGLPLPSGMNLTLSALFNYDANQHSLQVDLNTASMPSFATVSQEVILDHLTLSPAFFQSADFQSAMNAATIRQMTYHAQAHLTLPVSIIQNSFALVGNFLQNLSYTSLPIQFEADTFYQGNTHVQTGNAQLSIEDLGQFNSSWNVLVTTPPTPGNFAQLVLDPDAALLMQAMSTPNLIQSAQLSFIDQSFVNRFLQFLATNSNQSIANVQSALQTDISSFTQNLQIPQLTAIANTLNGFIANPSSLSLHLNPVTPFSVSDISNFLSTQQTLRANIQQNLSTLPAAQQSAFFAQYEAQSIQSYSNFFNKIGLSVSVNGISAS